MDYWGLNNLIIKNKYPLLLIDESLDQLDQAMQFIQWNLTNAYYQIKICRGNKRKMAFRIRYNYFEYQIMFFSLSNALVMFLGYINKILVEKLNIFVIVYLHNILIYTKDLGQPYVETVCWVLNQLRKHYLFANLKKCWFYQDEIYFLGYIVLSKSRNIKAKRIEVMKDLFKLKFVRNILVFLSFANFTSNLFKALVR